MVKQHFRRLKDGLYVIAIIGIVVAFVGGMIWLSKDYPWIAGVVAVLVLAYAIGTMEEEW